jgi:hypothetical protein
MSLVDFHYLFQGGVSRNRSLLQKKITICAISQDASGKPNRGYKQTRWNFIEGQLNNASEIVKHTH